MLLLQMSSALGKSLDELIKEQRKKGRTAARSVPRLKGAAGIHKKKHAPGRATAPAKKGRLQRISLAVRPPVHNF